MTTCLKESTLQAWLEEAGAGPLSRTVEGHLAACSRCREAFGRAVAAHRRVHAWLGDLREPAEPVVRDVRGALARVLWRAEADGAELPWYRRGVNPGAFATSLLVQGALVAALMLLGTNETVRRTFSPMTLIEPPPVLKPVEAKSGGGGGGRQSPEPPRKGELPKPATRVFVPPAVTVAHPALALDPSLFAPPDTWNAPRGVIGDPLALLGGGDGPGRNGGLGTGDGPGIGDKTGGGPDGDGGPRIFSVGRGTSAPSVLSRVDPEYSEEARKAKYSGAVMLSIVVSAAGRAEDIRVVRSLGMGLDEKAVEAVRQWRFRPGTNNGAPVRVRAQIEVNFRLL
jgi:TonB family protein